MTNYPIAKIFYSIQGEGHMRGVPMVFIRTAGCSIGCTFCDTDYTATASWSVPEIISRVNALMPDKSRDKWVWVTGGEPTDHKLNPLIITLRDTGYNVALATSGHSQFVPQAPVDFLSVSPHDPFKWKHKYGDELKIVSGLNNYNITEFLKVTPEDQMDFTHKFIQPMSFKGKEDPDRLAACKDFLKTHPNWCLSRQDHLYWDVE